MIGFLWSTEIERAAVTWWRGPSGSGLNPQLVMNILASWGFSRNSATAERSSLHLSSSASAARQHSRSRARIRVSGAGGEWQGETLARFQAHGQNRWEKWNHLHHCRTPTNPSSPHHHLRRSKEEPFGAASNTWIQFWLRCHCVSMWAHFKFCLSLWQTKQTSHFYKSKSTVHCAIVVVFFIQVFGLGLVEPVNQ